MEQATYLQIAGFNIKVKSQNLPQPNEQSDWRYQNFILKRPPGRIDLEFKLKIKDSYTRYRPRVLFETKRENSGAKRLLAKRRKRRQLLGHAQREESIQQKQKRAYLGDELDWRISRYKNRFLIEGGTSGNFQVFFDKNFKNIDIFIINSLGEWKLSDVFTGFLQLFMIYYLAVKKEGLVVHSTAIKDEQKKGKAYLFAGVSGAGKTTTSRIWDKYAAGIKVLNDDRIIIRKIKRKFYIYGTPWHGDFSDYLKTSIEQARLSNLFFIYHRRQNKAEKVTPREFFNLFFQSIFAPLWSKENLGFIFEFLMELILNVPCYKFGFKNNKKIIDYVRKCK